MKYRNNSLYLQPLSPCRAKMASSMCGSIYPGATNLSHDELMQEIRNLNYIFLVS